MMAERKILKRFDANGNGKLDRDERAAARAWIKENPERRPFGPGGPGGRGGFPGPGGPGGSGPPGMSREPARPGPRVEPSDVPPAAPVPLFDPSVMRTLFLTFEDQDWEQALTDFHNTDVELPATLLVDGETFHDVGVHFRGASSYMMVPQGSKRSFNVSLDAFKDSQHLRGAHTLNLLNANGDPSFLSSILYSAIASQYIPTPRANLVRVVVNGECWGVYVNVEQFDKQFVARHWGTTKGARWKVKGRPNGNGGLDFVGEDVDAYRSRYELKSKEDEKDWRDLIRLCRVLSETPVEELPKAIEPILDVEGALWFLALDDALANSDGYWTRASDYSLYKDQKGVFHVVPHDMNEAFGLGGGGPPMGRRRGRGADAGGPGGEGPQQQPGGGRPRGGGMGHGGPDLDPLVAMDDPGKPLRSRLLKVPEYRRRYLEHVRLIASHDLDWEWLGPIVARFRSQALEAVRADTRKLSSTEAFERATSPDPSPAAPGTGGAEGRPEGRPQGGASLRGFADARRDYLLKATAPGGAAAP